MQKYIEKLPLIIGLCLSFIMFPLVTQAESVDSTTTITLHKLLINDKHNSDEMIVQNDGSLTPAGLENLQEHTGLNGVTFTVYDVTSDFYQLRESGKSVEESQIELAKKEMTEADSIQTGTTKTVGKEDGILTFKLPKNQGNKEAVYLIKETDRPESIKEASSPLVVVLPILDNNEKEMNSVHLYVKNERINPDIPDLTKSINNNQTDFSIGDIISYKIETVIPQDILTHESYDLTDEADPALWMVKKEPESESVKARIKGTDARDFYQVIEVSDHGFKVSFDPKKLGTYKGKTIELTYEMVLKKSEPPQSIYNNTATLYPGNQPKIEAKQKIRTGGYHFRKVSITNQSQGLPGAEFVIKNKKQDYWHKQEDGINNWSKTSNDAISVTSDNQGNLSVFGLEDGLYSLEEVKAPKGYVLTNQAIPFKISETSFEDSLASPLKIVNQPVKNSSSSDKPARKGLLPQTNEKLSITLILAGVLLLMVLIKRKGEIKNENRK